MYASPVVYMFHMNHLLQILVYLHPLNNSVCNCHQAHRVLKSNSEVVWWAVALQAVVKAFRREERNQRALSRKRQRERFIQVNCKIPLFCFEHFVKAVEDWLIIWS
mgnify:CR=1 FL=1